MFMDHTASILRGQAGAAKTVKIERLARALLLICFWQGGVAAQEETIQLWPNGAPGSEHWEQVETETLDFLPHRVVRNVVNPTLQPFLAASENNSGVAVIVAPGGGFQFLSIETEGTQVAEWLQEQGINAFVLKYRLDETAKNDSIFKLQVAWMFFSAMMRGDEYPEIPLSQTQPLAIEDGMAAVRYIRQHADKWGIQSNAIGILGFSAGGAVATGTAMRGSDSSRPDFVGSVYGVPDTASVPENAPPLYIVATKDDPVVPWRLSELLSERWENSGYDSTLVTYADGGHGFGMQEKGASSDDWIEGFHRWLLAKIRNEAN